MIIVFFIVSSCLNGRNRSCNFEWFLYTHPRPNGVPYAALGLLWRVLGPGLVGERQARLIDENFIQPLDLNDNTGEQNLSLIHI